MSIFFITDKEHVWFFIEDFSSSFWIWNQNRSILRFGWVLGAYFWKTHKFAHSLKLLFLLVGGTYTSLNEFRPSIRDMVHWNDLLEGSRWHRSHGSKGLFEFLLGSGRVKSPQTSRFTLESGKHQQRCARMCVDWVSKRACMFYVVWRLLNHWNIDPPISRWPSSPPHLQKRAMWGDTQMCIITHSNFHAFFTRVHETCIFCENNLSANSYAEVGFWMILQYPHREKLYYSFWVDAQETTVCVKLGHAWKRFGRGRGGEGDSHPIHEHESGSIFRWANSRCAVGVLIKAQEC